MNVPDFLDALTEGPEKGKLARAFRFLSDKENFKDFPYTLLSVESGENVCPSQDDLIVKLTFEVEPEDVWLLVEFAHKIKEKIGAASVVHCDTILNTDTIIMSFAVIIDLLFLYNNES